MANFEQTKPDDLFRQYFNGGEKPEQSPAVESGMPEFSSEQPEVESDESSDVEAAQNEASSEDISSESADQSEDKTELSSSDSLKNKDKEATNSESSETVFVKGAEGRREKLVIDYSDRTAIKNAYLKAAGMRKYQAERDSYISKYNKLEKEFKSEKASMDKLESVYAEQGVKGLVSLLGGPEAWNSMVDSEIKRRNEFNSLSEEEKYKVRASEEKMMYEQRLAQERAARERFENQIKEREESAFVQKLQSQFSPVFDRYRFAGKLNDPKAENFYDEMIWEKAKTRLAEYPDDVELTPAIIDKEFRTVANMFRAHISQQAESKVKQMVNNKKVEATQKAQFAAKKGLKGNQSNKQIMDNLAKGDLSSALKLWMQNK